MGPGFGSNPSVFLKREKKLFFYANFSKTFKTWGGCNKIVRRDLKFFKNLRKVSSNLATFSHSLARKPYLSM